MLAVTDELVTLSAAQTLSSGTELTFITPPSTTPFAVSQRPFTKGATQYEPCRDGNNFDSNGDVIFIEGEGRWQDTRMTNCPPASASPGAFCSLMRNRRHPRVFSDQNLYASDACCICGGGVKATGVELVVSSRDPA
eukprot:SAG31_NODE_10401_length_1143_cov_1.373563_1_plen_136_part_10